jgi:two-component system cell cycle response regulator
MKVLIAEDDAVSRRVLEEFLTKWGYELVITQDGEEAWQALSEEDAPQLAILDWMMPRMDGLEVCRRVRERNAEPYVYILLLTAKGQKQDVVEGINAGADDYLSKPFDAGELQARLRAGRRILALQGALISARDALRFQATHDPLTGLWNRLAATEALRREIARARRQKSSVAVLLGDLDRFKAINDTYGHLAGDAALREVAKRMRTSVRVYDTVARYGGEEFLFVLPDCNMEAALEQGERLRRVFDAEPLDLPDARIPQTLSLGVASVDAKAGVLAEEMLRVADQALYRAKERGRNRVEPATGDELARCLALSSREGEVRHRKRNGGRRSAA